MDKGLYDAVIAQQNCDSVRNLVRDSPYIVNQLTPNGDTALHLAGSMGNVEIVQMLVFHKPCMLSTRNVKGETVLHKVVAARHTQAVNFLLSLPSPLECVCDLETGAHSVDTHPVWLAGNKENETALHYAAKCGDAEIAGAILEKVHGIAFVCNNADESPLYTACEEGRSDVAKIILEADCYVSIPDSRRDGRTCLHAVINLFSRVNPFQMEKKRQQIMDLLLMTEKRQLVGKADASGNLPLHLATMHKELQLVRKLVEVNSSMCCRLNNDGMAAIHIAAEKGLVDIMKCLIDSAPDCIHVLGKENKNALHFALENQHYRLASECVLDNSAVDAAVLVKEADNEGNTPLHTFANQYHPRQFVTGVIFSRDRLVLSKMVSLSGGNVNARNKDGNTFLDLIYMKGWFAYFMVVMAPFLSTTDLISNFRGENRLQKRNENNAASASQVSDESIQKRNETLSLIAVLLATVSYAAAFTIPGGFDSQRGIPVLMHAPALKVFIISDTLAMCLSIGALFTLLFRPVAITLLTGQLQPLSREKLENSSSLGVCLILLALYPTLVSFGSGVYVMVAPKCLWLAILVCSISIISLGFVVIPIPVPRILFAVFFKISGLEIERLWRVFWYFICKFRDGWVERSC